MGVRVSNDVLVVPPFDCAWLSSPDVEHLTTASAEGGEGIVVSFDAKADSDVTVILKGRPDVAKRDVDDRPARRLDHWSGRQDEGRHDSTSTYVIIVGSHRNSRLCIEKNGVVVELAKGPGVPTLPTRGRDAFTRCFVSWHPSRGALVVGAGEHARHAWVDPEPHTEAICEVGLSTWDDYAQYRDIEIRAIDPNGESVGNSWSATPMDSPRGGRWTTSPVGVGGKLTTSDDSSKVSTSAPSSLLALCIDTLARHLPAAAAHDPRGMRAMPPEHVAALLTHDALGDCVGSEDELWVRVQGWCVGRRGDEVREVLPHVRFPQLETETLDGVEAWATEIQMDPDAFEMLRELVAEARLRSLPEEGYRDEDFVSPPGSPLAARRMQVSPHGSSVRIAAAAAEGTSRRDRRLRARLNELASIRSKPRRGHGSVLSFICAGDSNGLFRYLGRTGAKGEGGRVTDFMNPARLGAVEVTASSPASRGGTSPHDVCAETFNRVNFAGPSRNSETGTTEGGWWRVDLGANKTLRCDYYAARRNGELEGQPRCWELGGSADGVEWWCLRRHENDGDLSTPGVWGAWPVPPPGSGRACRYLRVRLTENTHGTDGDVSGWRLRMSNLEFYGRLSTRRLL